MKKSSNITTISYTIIYEDGDYLVVNKACGTPVQAEGADLTKELSTHYNLPLHVINRLDQPVSGVVLYAKHHKAASYLSSQLNKGLISKSYLAVVEGHGLKNGDYHHTIEKQGNKTIVSTQGKEASLHVDVLKDLENYTLVKITTETGRFHQIRTQLAAEGFPIKGDLKYGAKRSNKEGGIYLHAHQLSFTSHNNKLIDVDAPPPSDKSLYFV
jgi:23S rRNA pseudouridine1911/1915/1917 synthase